MRFVFLLIAAMLVTACSQQQDAQVQEIPNIEVLLSKDLDGSISDVKTRLDYSLSRQSVILTVTYEIRNPYKPPKLICFQEFRSGEMIVLRRYDPSDRPSDSLLGVWNGANPDNPIDVNRVRARGGSSCYLGSVNAKRTKRVYVSLE